MCDGERPRPRARPHPRRHRVQGAQRGQRRPAVAHGGVRPHQGHDGAPPLGGHASRRRRAGGKLGDDPMDTYDAIVLAIERALGACRRPAGGWRAPRPPPPLRRAQGRTVVHSGHPTAREAHRRPLERTDEALRGQVVPHRRGDGLPGDIRPGGGRARHQAARALVVGHPAHSTSARSRPSTCRARRRSATREARSSRPCARDGRSRQLPLGSWLSCTRWRGPRAARAY